MRTRRSGDERHLAGAVTAILGWTHLLADERVTLSIDEVRIIARRIAGEASRIEQDWLGAGNRTSGGVAKTRAEAVAHAAQALHTAGSAGDVLGILCEVVHDLGGWVELDHGQAGSAVRIDLGVDSLPPVHGFAPPGSRMRDVIAEEVGDLVVLGTTLADALERERELAGLDLAEFSHDPLTGLLDGVALGQLATFVGPRHAVVGLRLVGLDRIADRQGQAVADLQARRLATMLQQQVRAYDYVFRASKDTFVVLSLTGRAGVARLVDRLRQAWAGSSPGATLAVATGLVQGRTGRVTLDAVLAPLASGLGADDVLEV